VADPIEIQIRDAMAADIATRWTVANGYQYDMGDINVWDRGLVETWPRLLIIPGSEVTDQEGSQVDPTYYHNINIFRIVGDWCAEHEFDDSGNPEFDPWTEAAKMAEDMKRYWGNIYQQAAAGGFQTRFIGHEKKFDNNDAYPIQVIGNVEVTYYQLRSNPNQSG